MKKIISKDEILIEGKEIFENGKWLLTEETKRVSYLVENVIKRIAYDPAKWTTLYLDESDGRYWEPFYDEKRGDWRSEGSPSLRHISETEAKEKYNI